MSEIVRQCRSCNAGLPLTAFRVQRRKDGSPHQGFICYECEKAKTRSRNRKPGWKPAPPSKDCEWCKISYVPSVHYSKYCCNKCAVADYNEMRKGIPKPVSILEEWA